MNIFKEAWADVTDPTRNMSAATVIVGTGSLVALSCGFNGLAGIGGVVTGGLAIVSIKNLYRDLFSNNP